MVSWTAIPSHSVQMSLPVESERLAPVTATMAVQETPESDRQLEAPSVMSPVCTSAIRKYGGLLSQLRDRLKASGPDNDTSNDLGTRYSLSEL